MRSGVLTGNDTRWRSASSGSPLPEGEHRYGVRTLMCTLGVHSAPQDEKFSSSPCLPGRRPIVYLYISTAEVFWSRNTDQKSLYYGPAGKHRFKIAKDVVKANIDG